MNAGRIAVMLVLAAAAGLQGQASAHESKYPHVHIGGGLSHPPYTFVNEVFYHDIVYDKTSPDPFFTSLDVYVADSSEPPAAPSPVMVWVHGGGLRMSDKGASKDLDPKPEYFTTKLGYILISVNYRLLPEGQFPTNVQDVANALAWVHKNIGEFGGDPEQIFLMGHSAGAQLVGQVATNDTFLKKAGTDLGMLKGVIANEGGYGVAGAGGNIKRWEMTYGPEWKKAVAISNVSAGKKIPPFLLFYVKGGSQVGDTDVQALEFAAALKAAGVRADVVPLDHVEHFGANERLGEDGDITTVSTENFLASIPGKKRAAKWVQGKGLN